MHRYLKPLSKEEYNLILGLVKMGRTYHQIVDEVKRSLGTSITTCHIAKVKRDAGIGISGAWNTGRRYNIITSATKREVDKMSTSRLRNQVRA